MSSIHRTLYLSSILYTESREFENNIEFVAGMANPSNKC